MGRSDFSRPVIVGYSLRPSRRGPGCGQPEQPPWRSPGSRTGHVRACQGLRRRGAARRLALATQGVWLSAGRTASAPRRCLTPLNGWPVRSPVNASRAAGDPRMTRGRRGSLLIAAEDFHLLSPAGLPAHPSTASIAEAVVSTYHNASQRGSAPPRGPVTETTSVSGGQEPRRQVNQSGNLPLVGKQDVCCWESGAMSKEHERLQEAREKSVPWKKWGPYLSERQWGTVREDYSDNGDAWNYLTHDQARSRLSMGRGGPRRHQRRPSDPVPCAGTVERQGPDPERAPVRARQQRGQPRRRRQGVLLLPRLNANPFVHEISL
jgi:hypothetical protein